MLNTGATTFTNAQERAINHFQGPCLVLAGPGSGKTKVITHRVAHLINEQKIPPEHILTITFTKAAALEMKERFLLLQPNTNAWFGTFHSLFYYILKNAHLNYPKTFMSTKERRSLLLKIVSKAKKDIAETDILQIEQMLSRYINTFFATEEFSQFADWNAEWIQMIYLEYKRALKIRNLADFDILLIDTYNLLYNHSEVAQKWQKQFPYILIDECQDMNLLQYEAIKLLTDDAHNIFMVGDDDQSIYRFRGANVSLMQRFLEENSNAKILQLDTNFRSRSEIVNASQKVIAQNSQRFQKQVVPFYDEKGDFYIKSFSYRKEMFKYVVEHLQNAPKTNKDTLAIICRTRAELRSWGHMLRQNNIFYQAKEERTSMFEEPWYLDMEAYLRLAIDKYEISDALRILNKPERGICREALLDSIRLPNKLLKAILPLRNMRPFLAFKYIWESIGYRNWIETTLYNQPEKQIEVKEAFEILLDESKKIDTLDMWMIHVEKERFLFDKKCKLLESTSSKTNIYLLTMHGAKGLEFDTVFLPDINQGKMPSGFLHTVETIEEERRLLYVAMTRAKKELQIFYIKGTEDHKLQPSEFLKPLLNE